MSRSAPTAVVALENTLNGTIIPQDEVVAISDYARSVGCKMHLDGARLWHVAAETQTPMKELCDPFDSVSLCFSKGLGTVPLTSFAFKTQLISSARLTRRPCGFLSRRHKRVHCQSSLVPQIIRGWNASDGHPSSERCLRSVVQLSPATARPYIGKTFRSWVGGDWRKYFEQGRNLYGAWII